MKHLEVVQMMCRGEHHRVFEYCESKLTEKIIGNGFNIADADSYVWFIGMDYSFRLNDDGLVEVHSTAQNEYRHPTDLGLLDTFDPSVEETQFEFCVEYPDINFNFNNIYTLCSIAKAASISLTVSIPV